MTEKLPGFDPDSDYPYPEDELARAALDRLRSRRKVVDRVVSVAWQLRRRPYNSDTGEIRSAFDEIWRGATEAYDLTSGPEEWTFHSRRLWAFPEKDIEGWHDLPTLDLASMNDWERMWLPKVMSPGKMYSCTRCTFTTCREDRARAHDSDDHPGENADISHPIASSSNFKTIDEDGGNCRSGNKHSGKGQHSLADFGGSR